MGIQERNLPVAESLDEGAMVRIVDGEGHSKNIDAEGIGSSDGVLIVTYNLINEDTGECDHTLEEIAEAIRNGRSVVAKVEGNGNLFYPSAIYDEEGEFNIRYDYISFYRPGVLPHLSFSISQIIHGSEDGEEYINSSSQNGSIQIIEDEPPAA